MAGSAVTPRPQGASNPGPPDKKSDRKPINHNNLQHRINHNNKERMHLRTTRSASECGVLLPKIGVC